ncbi:MAG: zinc ABC transporter substrate-binding protein [Lachnospiraceae bacterium]|nr:zinc ABC transporter substrate-binding protein [Lachnospiraceae bacterium]
MKRGFLSLVLVVCMASGLLACSAGEKQSEEKQSTGEDGTLAIMTTIFPAYDWVETILGENPANAKVSMLLDNGVDLHSYQPTAEDILNIGASDLFVYVGGESDAWIKDALSQASNPDLVAVNLLDVLGDKAREEELVEGMEEEEEEEEEAGEAPEYDEHVWLSLRNASVFVEAIAESLASIDPEHAQNYEKNAKAYLEQCAALDAKYQEAVSAADQKILLFGDRFPFLYLTEDYGLEYYAAFAGCSAETEASFETIVFLANKVDEYSLPAILTMEGSDHKMAETIRENTSTKDQKILTLDSMQSTTMEDVESGASFLSIMEANLAVLKEAL